MEILRVILRSERKYSMLEEGTLHFSYNIKMLNPCFEYKMELSLYLNSPP